MHVLSLHVAADYKIDLRPRETEVKEWKQEAKAITGDTYHSISAESPFGIALEDKNGNFVAIVLSVVER